MLTLRATLQPKGYIALPPVVEHDHPMTVPVTFLEEPVTVRKAGNAAATLALLQSQGFRALPKADKLDGKLEGEALPRQRLLTKRFGPLSPDAAQRLNTATSDPLETWADRILDAPSLAAVFHQH